MTRPLPSWKGASTHCTTGLTKSWSGIGTTSVTWKGGYLAWRTRAACRSAAPKKATRSGSDWCGIKWSAPRPKQPEACQEYIGKPKPLWLHAIEAEGDGEGLGSRQGARKPRTVLPTSDASEPLGEGDISVRNAKLAFEAGGQEQNGDDHCSAMDQNQTEGALVLSRKARSVGLKTLVVDARSCTDSLGWGKTSRPGPGGGS